MTAQPTGRYWVIRHRDDGSIIAKFDTLGETPIPESVADYGEFVIADVSDRSTFENKTIDQKGLSSSEKDRLRDVYPVE